MTQENYKDNICNSHKHTLQNQNLYIVFLILYCIFETDKFLNWNQCNKKILIILGQFEFAKACLQFLLQTLKKKGEKTKKEKKSRGRVWDNMQRRCLTIDFRTDWFILARERREFFEPARGNNGRSPIVRAKGPEDLWTSWDDGLRIGPGVPFYLCDLLSLFLFARVLSPLLFQRRHLSHLSPRVQ